MKEGWEKLKATKERRKERLGRGEKWKRGSLRGVYPRKMSG
jgi:hypothetical protein